MTNNPLTEKFTTKNTTVSSHQIRHMTLTAFFAALITIMTAYICHVPVGINGTYIHFGDSLIYLAASLLPTPYALVAAAIGGGLADLLTAPIWAPATILIKMLITLPFTSKDKRIISPRNIFASVLAFIITGIGYYIAEAILFGAKAALFISLSSNFVQSLASAIVFVILGLFLDKMNFKTRFLS